jgi:hypothetical protein
VVARGGGGATAGKTGALIGGTLTSAKPDARGWGWQLKASINLCLGVAQPIFLKTTPIRP